MLVLEQEKRETWRENSKSRRSVFFSPAAGLALFLLVIIEYNIEKDSCTCHRTLPRGGTAGDRCT